MRDDLLPLPLTPRTVHLCIDMQRIFSPDGPWATPWMERVLPVVVAISHRFPERTVFTRFITPQRASDMPGTWRRYYEKWRQATREQLDPRLLDLMPDLGKLAPPATVIDKTGIPFFSNPSCCTIFVPGRQTASSLRVPRPTSACWRRSWALSIMDTA
jgi:nicotinamidase-related amidase